MSKDRQLRPTFDDIQVRGGGSCSACCAYTGSHRVYLLRLYGDPEAQGRVSLLPGLCRMSLMSFNQYDSHLAASPVRCHPEIKLQEPCLWRFVSFSSISGALPLSSMQ